MAILNSKQFRLIMTSLTLSLALVLGACSPADDTTGTTTAPAAGQTTAVVTTTEATETTDADETTDGESEGDLELTLDELAEYDGQDGRDAYVAVDGVIYDFTPLGGWDGGEHNGYEAGQDLTDEIDDESPHGRDVLDRAEVVGRLVD